MTEYDENFEENTDVPQFDDTNNVQEASSSDNLFGATWSLELIEEDSDFETLYQNADNQYKAAKIDIEMSKSPEEQAYWQKRADELWQQRDVLDGKIEDNKQNKLS